MAVAVLALFVAMGGTGYAITQVSGAQIKNRSIAANKVKLNVLTAKEVKEAALADKVRQLVVSKRAPKKKGKITAAAAGDGTVPSLITLKAGETATLVQSGPLGYEVRCAGDPNSPQISIWATSTEPGALVDIAFDPNTLHAKVPALVGPGEPGLIVPPNGDYFSKVPQGRDMIAPSGASLHVGAIIYGTKLYGAQCAASAFAVG
jgi:hypothetical protein